MAKRKKKKAPQSAPKDIAQVSASTREHASGDSSQQRSEQPKSQIPASGVRYSVFIIGMILTFVLGLYIGTLLPGLHSNEMKKPDAMPQPVSQAPETDKGLQGTIAELEKKAAANLDSAPEWINLGNIYFDAHMPQKAISAYEHALQLAPKNADVLTDLGIMYRETGQYEKAVECFRKAIAIEPGHQNAMYNEGVVLSSDLHRKDDAAIAWQRLLEFYPQAKAPNGTPISEMIKQLQ